MFPIVISKSFSKSSTYQDYQLMCGVQGEAGGVRLATLDTFMPGPQALGCQVLQVLWERQAAQGAQLSLGADRDQVLDDIAAYKN